MHDAPARFRATEKEREMSMRFLAFADQRPSADDESSSAGSDTDPLPGRRFPASARKTKSCAQGIQSGFAFRNALQHQSSNTLPMKKIIRCLRCVSLAFAMLTFTVICFGQNGGGTETQNGGWEHVYSTEGGVSHEIGVTDVGGYYDTYARFSSDSNANWEMLSGSSRYYYSNTPPSGDCYQNSQPCKNQF